MAVLKYKKNAFYIEDVNNAYTSGIYFMSDESHDMISLLSSKTFEDVESFEKAISLGHEVNHYMQDDIFVIT